MITQMIVGLHETQIYQYFSQTKGSDKCKIFQFTSTGHYVLTGTLSINHGKVFSSKTHESEVQMFNPQCICKTSSNYFCTVVMYVIARI